ncbi:MAG: hypothetical protein RL120_01750 [Gammaproteobacteria bacterium]
MKHYTLLLLLIGLALAGTGQSQAATSTDMDFMIGEFDRRERLRNPDGSWGPWQRGEWIAGYIMDGRGVLDETHNFESGVRTTNVRIFDELGGTWKVNWFKTPLYSTLVAEGGSEGEEVVFLNPENLDRWVFYDITPDSYRWRQERIIGGSYLSVFEIECTRRQDIASNATAGIRLTSLIPQS